MNFCVGKAELFSLGENVFNSTMDFRASLRQRISFSAVKITRTDSNLPIFVQLLRLEEQAHLKVSQLPVSKTGRGNDASFISSMQDAEILFSF
jgi:hypothetical protein